ncbi:OmpA family protein [Marinobacterium sp. xm-a-152]|uniref:OmpA family protein n=1 Tax=Marinobacterium sp. xm-a-152 TaxID=2497733 RepID=UPI001569A49B|nr:OmpA family protein [Marinobacterium sp. xm-a-152]NRP14409.1 flagellar motor protein MotB [Marinobacterium sp. xm-a-152]
MAEEERDLQEIDSDAEVAVVESDPPPEKEVKCEECKPGAPLWMATFADMATLLMAFFVLILSFTEQRQLKYLQAAGALSEAFGVQKEVQTFERPDGTMIINNSFSSSMSNPTIVPSVEQSKVDEIDPERDLDRNRKEKTESDTNTTKEQLEELLAEYVARGQVEVRQQDNQVIVEMKSTGSAEAESEDKTKNVGGVVPQERVELLRRIAEFQQSAQSPIEVLDYDDTMNWAKQDPNQNKIDAVAHKIDQLNNELAREIATGIAEIEQQGDQVIVRLAEQATFPEGGAEMSQHRAEAMLRKVSSIIAQNDGPVTIEGHTDAEPLPVGGKYPSNWDLSIARASSVANSLTDQFAIPSDRLTIKGYANTKPPREGSLMGERRIEIVMDVN